VELPTPSVISWRLWCPKFGPVDCKRIFGFKTENILSSHTSRQREAGYFEQGKGIIIPVVGQIVNKVASSSQLRFDIHNFPSLEGDIKERIMMLAGSRMTEDGIFIIQAKRYRPQDQNRADAIFRLTVINKKATTLPKVPKATDLA
jgi:hypothetical protein